MSKFSQPLAKRTKLRLLYKCLSYNVHIFFSFVNPPTITIYLQFWGYPCSYWQLTTTKIVVFYTKKVLLSRVTNAATFA